MKAIILSAGRGKRLGHLTDDSPKGLIEVGGKPLIRWQIEALQGAGIKEIGIVCGYKSEMFDGFGLTKFINPNWEKTNMVVSLICAKDWLEKDTCIVSYSDIIYPAETISKTIAEPGDIVIPYNCKWLDLWKLRFEDPLTDAETFRVDDKGFLLEIGNKPTNINEIMGQYMGLVTLTPNGWDKISTFIAIQTQENMNTLDLTGLLNNLIKQAVRIKCIPINDKWCEVDNEKDLFVCNQLLSHNIWKRKHS